MFCSANYLLRKISGTILIPSLSFRFDTRRSFRLRYPLTAGNRQVPRHLSTFNVSHFQLNEEVAATKQELMAEKQLSEKSQKELETDLISSKHRYYYISCLNNIDTVSS